MNLNKLQLLAKKENCSWILLLNPDPETDKYNPNKTSREVKSGHYVIVKPTPLPNPHLVIYSPEMAHILELDDNTCTSNEFLSLFSGNINHNKQTIGKKTWASPYALSIYGQEMYSNCPFKNGNGYGDGRAITLTEILINQVNYPIRWELQLKGSGTTPFCRGGDGRAVLRSCIREFIASEAMFHLNVPTTRALCIIASKTEKVMRQWYSQKGIEIMENSTCAILCRASSSFIRVGHIELFSRRARKEKTQFRLDELKSIVNFTIFREFPDLNNISNEQDKYIMMLEDAAIKIGNMTVNWMRVGYTQGNFNSDNCHVAGKTIDYGPFGFIEIFDPLWNMWADGGKHFSFMNQVNAGNKNFCSLVDSVIPLLDYEYVKIANELKNHQYQIALDALNLMWANKLGFNKFNSKVDKIKIELFELMELYMADFTIFWRQLAQIVEEYNIDYIDPFSVPYIEGDNNTNYLESFNYLKDCFYKNLTLDDKYKWANWLSKWIKMLQSTNIDFKIISTNMKKISPKFVPREWIHGIRKSKYWRLWYYE